MKEIKLATQLNLIFSLVTLLTSLIFIVALNRVFSEFRVSQNELQLSAYLNEVSSNIANPPTSEYNGYIIAQGGNVVTSYHLEVLDDAFTADEVADIIMYLTELCAQPDINMADAVQTKIDKNKQRFQKT